MAKVVKPDARQASPRASSKTSPGIAHSPFRLCPPHLRQDFACRYQTLKILAFSSGLAASYAISVRRASVLPAASSGFHLATATLAVRLTIPPAGFVEDFHLQVTAALPGAPSKNEASVSGPRSCTTWDSNPPAVLSHKPSGRSQQITEEWIPPENNFSNLVLSHSQSV